MMETSYIVLIANKVEGDLTDDYNVIGHFKASSASAALREAANSGGPGSGTYVAIPSRSWNPTTVKVETKQVVSLG